MSRTTFSCVTCALAATAGILRPAPKHLFATAFILLVWAGTAHATTPALGGGVPEIDAGSIASAMTLLFGGVLLLTDRYGRK
jgi:hypothetical protein